MKPKLLFVTALFLFLVFLGSLKLPQLYSQATPCLLVEQGIGPSGETELEVQTLAQGLTVPWAIAFLPDASLLVTEREGNVLRLQPSSPGMTPTSPSPSAESSPQGEPNEASNPNTTVVAQIPVRATGEGGLLGIAVHPQLESHPFVYLYSTYEDDGAIFNRIQRYRISPNYQELTFDRTLLDQIPAASFHNGGRLRFGPDGNLYATTGDATNPESAQNPESLAGKILRITDAGAVPQDNPLSGSPVFLSGVRNPQGITWLPNGKLVLTDHGPSGEMGRTGGDEITIAEKANNLGWPNFWKCETGSIASVSVTPPIIAWEEANPPGGIAFYQGTAIPDWNGNIIFSTLLTSHLHRLVLSSDQTTVTQHSSYLMGDYGRLRETIEGPEGALYISTSNCDGRGVCPPQRDRILKISQRTPSS